jgi:hypothetical protein
MKSFKNLIKGLKEDENTTSPQPYPFAPEAAKPEAQTSSRKKVQANTSPWSNQDDPNTIKIGEVTPVDTDPQLDTKNPKPSNVPVGQNTTVESTVNEAEYNLSTQKSTLEKDMAFAKYHRDIAERVMEIVKRRQKHADLHGIRPFGNMAPMQTESSSGTIVRHPVEVVGHIIDAAMKGLGTDARLNIHVPRTGELSHAQSRLGAETNKNAKKAKPEEKPVAKEPEREKTVNDKLMAAVGKMGENVNEGFMKRRYNISDIHSEVDKFHPSVPHENVLQHIDNKTAHWADPVQKSQAASDASMYHERRQKDFRKSQSSQKLTLASQATDGGSGISENLGATNDSSGGADGVGTIDKANVKKNKIRQGIGKDSKSSFNNKNWNSPGVVENFGPVKWSDLKALNEIMGLIDNRKPEDFPKTKEDYLKHAIKADKSAQDADKRGKGWHAMMFRRIRDRHLVHYINRAEPDELHKLHKAMTTEEFEAMMKDKYPTK